MHYFSEIIEKFPIRKKAGQKDAFLRYASEKAQAMGYSAQVDEIKGSRNLIAGNPESAKVIFTAHYDTPATMPFPNFITPRNILFYILYQLLPVTCICLIGGLMVLLCQAAFSVTDFATLYAVFMVCYFGCLMLLLYGPANKNNYNDNTSGIATLLQLMEKLPESARKNAAFIFFDNEEKHMQGSGNYAKKHQDIKRGTLVINLDCVGDGEHFLCIAKRGAALHALHPLLQETLVPADGKSLLHIPALGSVYPSDQASFRCGVALCACKKAPILGHYLNRIHTKRDTVCDLTNIDFLTAQLCAFTEKIDA